MKDEFESKVVSAKSTLVATEIETGRARDAARANITLARWSARPVGLDALVLGLLDITTSVVDALQVLAKRKAVEEAWRRDVDRRLSDLQAHSAPVK